MRKMDTSIMKILPLSQDNIREAMLLIEKIFPYKSDQKTARFSLYDSLGDQEYGQRYWVAVTEKNEVIGITGLYKDGSDKSVIWLGWFGVSKDYREKGIGSELLKYAINKAKTERYKKLRLYTSSEEREAHALYKKFDFTRIDIKNTSEKIYFEKKLKAV